MGCCGKNRAVARFTEGHETPRVTFTPPVTSSAEYFEYVGKTALTAVGSVTRRMAGVPNLRRTKPRE